MLELEPLIRDRIAARVDGLKGVHSAISLTAESVAGKALPAVFVAADGYKVKRVSGQNKGAEILTRWLVIIAVREVSTIRTGERARAATNDIARAALQALMGWQPRPGVGSLACATPPRPHYLQGALLYPLAFECTEVIKGDPS